MHCDPCSMSWELPVMGSHGRVQTLVPEEPFIRGDGHRNRVMGLHTAILSSLRSRSRAPHRGDKGSKPGLGSQAQPCSCIAITEDNPERRPGQAESWLLAPKWKVVRKRTWGPQDRSPSRNQSLPSRGRA